MCVAHVSDFQHVEIDVLFLMSTCVLQGESSTNDFITIVEMGSKGLTACPPVSAGALMLAVHMNA